ncbi:hypothetical protein [Reinekea sp.]|jgi:chromosome segregation and condensation protein ScpB|uniref:hypothetical protein n=1 Tax=Reinekea sp. TaxID=1970455 RepID=UPI003989422F
MFKEILTSVRAQLYERAVSPLMGSFVISWLLWNYKIILVLFSDLDLHETIKYIEITLYPTWNDFLPTGVLFPLISALAYIFIYPYPARWVFRFTQTQQTINSNLKKEIEGKTLLTEDEARKLRLKINELEREFESIIEEKNQEISDLKTELQSPNELSPAKQGVLSEISINNEIKQGDLDGIKKDGSKTISESFFSNTSSSLSNSQINILNKIGNNPFKYQEMGLVYESKNKISTRYDINLLIELGLIKEIPDEMGNGNNLDLTQKGRKFMIENNLQKL